MSGAATRAHIVEAADQLFYRQGYEHTSFTAIAEAVQLSRGNFYYHFKSKDEILGAVIGTRLDDTRRMLRQWEAEEAGPTGRIRKFIEILLTNRTDIERYGCPVGTLTTELAKLNHSSLAEASEIFSLHRSWLRDQFVLLGRPEQADSLAMHVLAVSQGVATLANAFRDEEFTRREVRQLCDWLSTCAEGTEDRVRETDGPAEA